MAPFLVEHDAEADAGGDGFLHRFAARQHQLAVDFDAAGGERLFEDLLGHRAVLAGDEGLAREFGDIDAVAVRPGMVGRQHQHDVLVDQAVADQVVDRRGQGDDGEIDPHLRHQVEQGAGIVHARFDQHPRMGGAKAPDQRQRHVRAAEPDREVAAAHLPAILEPGRHILQALDDRVHRRQQRRTVGGQLDAGAAAMEQPAAHRFLERPNVLGDGGLADIEQLRRRGKGPLLGHRVEGAQLGEVHLGSSVK